MEAMLLHFEDERSEAARLAQAAGIAHGQVIRCASTKNELGLDLPRVLPPQVALYRNFAGGADGASSLHPCYLLELLLLERMVSRQGVNHLTLVAPYLGKDLSQDRHDAGAQVLGGFLAGLFDVVLTIDPELFAVSSLGECLPLHHARLPDGQCAGKQWSGAKTACKAWTEPSSQALLLRLGSALRSLY